MCLAIPVCVTENIMDGTVRVRVGASDTFLNVSTLLLEAEPQPGTYLITHAGFALHTLDEKQAQESLALLRQVAEQDGSPSGF